MRQLPRARASRSSSVDANSGPSRAWRSNVAFAGGVDWCSPTPIAPSSATAPLAPVDEPSLRACAYCATGPICSTSPRSICGDGASTLMVWSTSASSGSFCGLSRLGAVVPGFGRFDRENLVEVHAQEGSGEELAFGVRLGDVCGRSRKRCGEGESPAEGECGDRCADALGRAADGFTGRGFPLRIRHARVCSGEHVSCLPGPIRTRKAVVDWDLKRSNGR